MEMAYHKRAGPGTHHEQGRLEATTIQTEETRQAVEQTTVVWIVEAKKASTGQTSTDYDNRADDDESRGRVHIDAHVRRNPPGRETFRPGPGNSRRKGTQTRRDSG